jgi:8-oxo-dGTP diphosphatase
MLMEEKCPRCGYVTRRRRNPVPTVDIIIEIQDQGLVLIERANPPPGWALPGGFVDYGESLEAAAIREAREETGLAVTLLGQFHTYSDPRRDPRLHTITTVYVAQGSGDPKAADDARNLAIFAPEQLPPDLAFDHSLILLDYLKMRPEWLAKIKNMY